MGSKDVLLCDCGGFRPRLLSGRIPEVKPYLRRIPGATGYIDGPHEQDWIRACKESPDSRVLPSAHFGLSGPFNEMVLLGVLAIRLQSLNKSLHWDAVNMRFTNIGSGDMLRVLQSSSFKMVDGRPVFSKKRVDLNALEMANEYIKHTYREGWELPDIPS